MGDNVIFVQRKEEVASILTDKVLEVVASQNGTTVTPTITEEDQTESDTEFDDDEIML